MSRAEHAAPAAAAPAPLIALESARPQVADTAWIAHTAVVVGDVEVGENSSIYYGAVIRADWESITIGPGSNIQDCAVLHADPGHPTRVGARVSVGHGTVLHGCTIGDDCLVGMNATVMNGADIGAQSLVAAGALVAQNAVVPPRSLVAGVPARVRRELTDAEIEANLQNATAYRDRLLPLHRRHDD